MTPDERRHFVIGFLMGVSLALLFVGCAHPRPLPPPPVLGPAVDVEKLLPSPAERPVIPSDIQKYDEIQVSKGQCGPGMPGGTLVSDYDMVQTIILFQERERYEAEAKAYQKLRNEERAACESLLSAQRDELVGKEAELRDAIRWGNWKLYIGIAIGAGTMFAATWAAGRLR